jgi:hypothetical protein
MPVPVIRTFLAGTVTAVERPDSLLQGRHSATTSQNLPECTYVTTEKHRLTAAQLQMHD